MTIAEMTEKQWYDTWHYIGECFEKEPKQRTAKQEFYTSDGLCDAFAERIGAEIGYAVQKLTGFYGYFFPRTIESDHTREHDLLRATYAYFFAHMGKAEFMAMTGGV